MLEDADVGFDMHGTVSEKIWRLAKSLAENPRYAYRYLVRGPFSRTTPLELELPWFSESAIDFLAGYLRPEMVAFEWGAGGSTVFLAARVKALVSVENDQAWIEQIKPRLARRGLDNVKFLHRPYDFWTVMDFQHSSYLHALEGLRPDVILVDGAEYDIQVRPDCFFVAERFIKEGGIIIVDDSWRYTDIRNRSRARRVRVFESTGPCRPGVTSTDVHFY